MKVFCTLLFLLCAAGANGQCKGIKIKEDKRRGTTTLFSSFRLPVGVNRIVTETTDSFFVVCSIYNQTPAPGTRGVRIRFSDNTDYVDTVQKARLNYINDKFYYTCSISIAADSVKRIFMSKDVIEVNVGRYKRDVSEVEAAALHRYLECMLKE
jgi:hypothetical protein